MQLWMEMNVVTLLKVVETMPQKMCSVIKAKGGPTGAVYYQIGYAFYLMLSPRYFYDILKGLYLLLDFLDAQGYLSFLCSAVLSK